ncbi:MAG: bile acid:sodium symporter [Desulfobacula sp.]|uniref:bile acid:sodium symporter n=1 Tax=Desulfobacula sp. TaxID=2593537 RepID=UPI001E03FC1C|nr:bile acid:sodium symporter [Desulfobacula sp.]MBT3487328.1 bile acid:sodium symporter [Desulfobacula sp.]MBT3807079.1 bile acid:sodium symporter [Desulfobacula sp.]MBT4027190.1 bile acid:sodium symporter [Desulfobacula sp.]MBT4201070.1 bile acid:sodium symporter [Desulfobacula sp.]
MVQKVKKQWFLLSLVFVFAAVIFDSSNILVKIGFFLKGNHGPEVLIFIIFIISGLLIESDQIKAGIQDIKSTVLALAVIIIIAPIAAGLICLLPLETGVAIGLFIVAVMPTTLSSGIVMTGTAGGNMAHALLITILSNFIGIFSIPVILSILLSSLDQQKELMIDRGAIFFKLIILVLFPLMIGIVSKAVVFKTGQLGQFKLQVVNQWMIIGVVFIALSGVKQVILGSGLSVFYILVLVSGFHLMLLGSCFLLVSFFGVEKGRYESIFFMGSQKTLALSAMIQVTYFSEFGTALLVCVLHHIVHLMMDGYLSTSMNNGLSFKNK